MRNATLGVEHERGRHRVQWYLTGEGALRFAATHGVEDRRVLHAELLSKLLRLRLLVSGIHPHKLHTLIGELVVHFDEPRRLGSAGRAAGVPKVHHGHVTQNVGRAEGVAELGDARKLDRFGAVFGREGGG